MCTAIEPMMQGARPPAARKGCCSREILAHFGGGCLPSNPLSFLRLLQVLPA